jgi:hypothetical protein
MDNILDLIGGALWWGILVCPIVIFFLVFKFIHEKLYVKIIIAISVSFILSAICFYASIGIIFRNGMGPG